VELLEVKAPAAPAQKAASKPKKSSKK